MITAKGVTEGVAGMLSLDNSVGPVACRACL
jgi:hypothetical protein